MRKRDVRLTEGVKLEDLIDESINSSVLGGEDISLMLFVRKK